jgi:hypothetical protein
MNKMRGVNFLLNYTQLRLWRFAGYLAFFALPIRDRINNKCDQCEYIFPPKLRQPFLNSIFFLQMCISSLNCLIVQPVSGAVWPYWCLLHSLPVQYHVFLSFDMLHNFIAVLAKAGKCFQSIYLKV